MNVGYWHYAADGPPSESLLTFLRQVGVDELVLGYVDPGTGPGSIAAVELIELASRCRDFGVPIAAVENVGLQHRLMEPVILGRADRDARLAELAAAVRSIGLAGIPCFGYHWLVPPTPERPSGVIRTSPSVHTERGTLVQGFDLDGVLRLPWLREREFTAEELWENHRHFLETLLPVAEEVGVTLCLHPDDPPLTEPLGGIARLFGSLSGFERVLEEVGDRPWGLTFCLGNWQLIGDDELSRAIRLFGPLGKLKYAHLQAVHGTPERFVETSLEDSDMDYSRVIRLFAESGFDGTIAVTHLPRLHGDPDGLRAAAYGVGYLRALLTSAEAGDRSRA